MIYLSTYVSIWYLEYNEKSGIQKPCDQQSRRKTYNKYRPADNPDTVINIKELLKSLWLIY